MSMDTVIANLIERVTRLEAANEVNLPQLNARMRQLEEAAEQARIDREQADRRELAELRRRLDLVDAELD